MTKEGDVLYDPTLASIATSSTPEPPAAKVPRGAAGRGGSGGGAGSGSSSSTGPSEAQHEQRQLVSEGVARCLRKSNDEVRTLRFLLVPKGLGGLGGGR